MRWLGRTGDLGQFDQDQFLTICGPKKNVIIKGGETIVPEDIEKVAQRRPALANVAALGRGSQFFGELIELFVEWQDDLQRRSELEEVLRKSLPKL